MTARRFLFGAAIRTLVALLFAPSIYALWLDGLGCVGAVHSAGCLVDIAWKTPMVLVLMPVFTGEFGNGRLYLEILAIALALGLTGEGLRAAFHALKKSDAPPP